MTYFKIVRSNETESTYEIKSKSSKIEKKYHDDHLQVSMIHMSADRILYIEPLPTKEAYKTYYIIKGSCFVFEDESIVKEGDFFVCKNTEEIQTIKTLEDTVLLVHATNYDVFKTLEDNHTVVDKLLKEIQFKDHYTGEHSLRVYELVKRMALKFGFKSKALNNFTKAAYYHDLGKVKIPDDILNKPDQLSASEFEEIKLHVQYSKEMILENFNSDVFDIIIQHHERYNGSGYPFGLKGEEICLEARILAVCDSYDAMITDRIYKKGKSIEIALIELRELAGILYDPEVVKVFIDMILE
ncbi:HD-GYP domain-containing protein [Fusibacter bizertensis]|uniref:HD-GYP domain-containing protein n=1 Tax=Fusibacter bizertensis TaxID=1488331 RepID=A0ABT6NFT9_9FIRM|nr:HD-GYP domain-containing protein [Fusibacter bizertensis]MDH8679242.1 HD-GYP domain-containing protein [Fusibacter bizertensis]